MKSKIYSGESIRTTSRGKQWIPALLAIVFFMAFPMLELMKLGNWSAFEYGTEQTAILYENLWRDGFMMAGFVAAGIAAVINGVSGFYYLYSAKKVDLYHSLPINRAHMFWHRAFVGVIYYLAPYLVMEFLAVCIGAMRGFFNLGLMKMALGMLFVHLLLYLILYFGVVLVICMTGNYLMGALALFGFFTYLPVLGRMLSYYQEFFFANCGVYDYGIVKLLKESGSVVLLGITFLSDYEKGSYGTILVVVIIVILLLAGASFIAYQRRNSENTGKAMVYPWSGVVLKFIVVIPVGLGVGLVFYMLPESNARISWWIAGLIFGTVLAHGIMEVIYQMDFHKFFSHRLQLLTAGCVVAVCAVCFQQDLLGYDTYLPNYKQLENIKISFPQIGMNSWGYISRNEDGTYEIIHGTDGKLECSSVGVSQEIYQSLEEAVRQQNSKEDFYSIPIKYEMKSGREVYRNYHLTAKQMNSLLGACYEERTMIDLGYSFLQTENKYLQRMSGTFGDGADRALFENDKAKQQELVEALKEDVKEADAQTMQQIPCALLDFTYEGLPVKMSVANILSGENSFGAGYYSSVYIYPGFKRTVALLKETGYPLSIEECRLEYAKISPIEVDEKGNYRSLEETEITDEKQLEELKKYIYPSIFINAWKENYRTQVNLRIKVKNSQEELYVSLVGEKFPDFIEKALAVEDSEDGLTSYEGRVG